MLEPHGEAQRARLLVGQAVRGQRDLELARLRVDEHHQAHGRPDERRQALRHHPVERLGLGDQRPVAADLVQERQVARPRLRALAVPLRLVVQRLEAQERAHLEDERRVVDGLLQEVVGARLVGLAQRGRLGHAREHQHRQRGSEPRADARAGLDAVDARQAQVQHHQVEPAGVEQLERPLAGVGPLGRMVVQGQEIDERTSDPGIVVDDQDAGHQTHPPSGHRL